MIQLNRIQLASETRNHVEITKILSTSQRESRIIDCYYQNWFLKRRLDTNLCQPNCERLTIRFEEKFTVVKPIIFTTQKMKFSVKDLFKKSE